MALSIRRELGGSTDKKIVIAADELREVLDRALADLDADERSGAVLRATGLELRLELTDLDLVVRVEASDEPGRHVRWAFADDGRGAKLDLRMDAATANAYLQGQESLPIAIARGRVKCSGGSKIALLYLPVLRLVAEPYRRWAGELHPHLAIS